MKPLTVLNAREQCVLQEMIARRGIVYVPDVTQIASVCDLDVPVVMELVNATSPPGMEISRRINEIVAHVPLASNNRQLAYAQMLLEDKINRRSEANLPLSDKDALDILDFARKHTNQPGVNINVQNNTAQLFNLASLNDEKLQQLIAAVQGAIETGEIIDAEFVELTSRNALATIAGCQDRED